MIGNSIGKYRIVGQLGRGGMGAVYRAVDETLGREVAIKVLTPDMSSGEALQLFELEARALARLNHPQIAGIHGVHREGTHVLMVMELVSGETLEQLLARLGPLSPEQAAVLAAQMLSALSHAHAAGVVHRDLKPSNVMVTETGGIKLLDFGTSRVSSAALMTAAGPSHGICAYMAPERILGHEVDGRADLYSVGVLLYQLLTSALPFEGTGPADVIQRQLADAPIPIASRRADVPGWCERVLARALAKPVADRYQSADEFRLDLLAVVPAATDLTALHHVAVLVPTPDTAMSPGAGAPAVDPWAPTLTAPIPDVSGRMPAVPAGVLRDTDVAAPAAGERQPEVDPLAPTLAAPIPDIAGQGSHVSIGVPSVVDAAPVPASAPAAMAAPAVDPLAPTLAAAIPELTVLHPLPAPVDSLAPTLVMRADAGAPPANEARSSSQALGGTREARATEPAPLGAPLGVDATALAPPGNAPTVRGPAGEVTASMPGPPEAYAPTAPYPAEAFAPTLEAPVPPPGTLVMPRKQFAAAGVLLGALVLAVVVLAVIVLRQPAPVVVAPVTPAPVASAPEAAAATPAPIEAPPASPLPAEIVDPPLKLPDSVPPASASASARPAGRESRPVETPAAAATARAMNPAPFTFDAKAVVADGDKRRERDALVLVADGVLRVNQKDDRPLYQVAVPAITGLTYSNSRQPLWSSPSGVAEAMKVEGGAFGFLKGGGARHWMGIQTPESLLMLRLDEDDVSRVIAALQDRVGLPVARLIEPRE